MKNILIVLLSLFIFSCNEQPTITTKTNTVVIYDTLETQEHRFRIKYNLPPEYSIICDSTSKEYIVAFWFGDLQENVYLQDTNFGIVMFYYEQSFADKFKSPKDCIPLIKKHWASILADRASHKK